MAITKENLQFFPNKVRRQVDRTFNETPVSLVPTASETLEANQQDIPIVNDANVLPVGDEDILANKQQLGRVIKQKKPNRRAQVEGREGKQKYYTVLTNHYRPGDIIDGKSNSLDAKKKQQIFLTNQPRPHYSIADNDDKMERGIMYQVQPLGQVHYGSNWDELYTKKVKVLAVLGSTKGFYHRLQNELKHQSDDNRAMRKNTSSVRAFGGDYHNRERPLERQPSPYNDTSEGKQLLAKIRQIFG